MRQEADFDVSDFENSGDTKGVFAKFYHDVIPNEEASALAGRPKYDDVEFIEIIAAGNSNNIVRRPVEDKDRNRFRGAYAKFKDGDKEQLTGTPLSEVTWISASMIKELMYINCRSLEHLAGLNDQACTSMPGLYELKRKAVSWLEQADKAAPFTKLHQENEELRNRLAALEASMAKKKS